MPQDRKATLELIREILGDRYTHFIVERVVVEESLREETTLVSCEVSSEGSGERTTIQGRGVGLIDAVSSGFIEKFATDYPSLKTIRFHSFNVRGCLETKHEHIGSDSQAEVVIELANSEDRIFTFTSSSRSVTSSAVATTLEGLEYFMNSERAFVTIYHALKDAEGRGRSDLIQRYTNMMAVLVQNTSYSQLISEIRKESAL